LRHDSGDLDHTAGGAAVIEDSTAELTQHVGEGLAVGADVTETALRAVDLARTGWAGRRPHLACVFVRSSNPSDASRGLRAAAEAIDARTTIGASVSGVLGSGRRVDNGLAVSVWGAVLPGSRTRGFHLEVMRTGDSLAVIGMPPGTYDDVLALLLADAGSFPTEQYVETSHEALSGLPVVGGVVAPSKIAGETRLLIDDRVHERGAVGLVLGGDVRVDLVTAQGAFPIGDPMTVTSTEGSLITGLAGRPATAVLHDIVAALPREQQAIAHDGLHVGVALDEYVDAHGPGGFAIRGVAFAQGHQHGALQVDGTVHLGQTVRFHLPDADAAHEELQVRLDRYRELTGSSIAGALTITDVGRGDGFFESRDHDIDVIGDRLPGTAAAGLVTQGQIAPSGGRSRLHTYATTMAIFPTSTRLAPPMGEGPEL